MGSGLAKFGDGLGDAGSTTLIVGSVTPLTILPGIAIGTSLWIVGAPFYYTGHALRGTNSEGYTDP